MDALDAVKMIDDKMEEVRGWMKGLATRLDELVAEKQKVCPHPIKGVMEYDGSFWCGVCGRQWHPMGDKADELPPHFNEALARRAAAEKSE